MDEKRLFRIHEGWGHHIEFMDWDTRKIHGHLPNRPEVGDYLEAEMKSGKIALFRFTEVDLMYDPPDQFFGTVEDVGYRDEVDCKALGVPDETTKSMFV